MKDKAGYAEARAEIEEELRKEGTTENVRRYYIGALLNLKRDTGTAIGERPALKIAEKYGCSQQSVYKYAAYARAVDEIGAKCRELYCLVLAGGIQIMHGQALDIACMPEADVRKLYKKVTGEGRKTITRADLDSIPPGRRVRKIGRPADARNAPIQAEIKKMPKYDPDAVASSLALTVPSWITSMRRVHDTADFAEVSHGAKWKLILCLYDLRETLNILLGAIKEGYDAEK